MPFGDLPKMAKNTEHLGLRVPASLKQSIDKIPADNSEFVRDTLQRAIDNRELMKDKQKKKAPAQIERVKELTTEINQLDQQVEKTRSRFEEIRDTLQELESERNKKKSLKQDIMDEIEEDTDTDRALVEAITEAA